MGLMVSDDDAVSVSQIKVANRSPFSNKQNQVPPIRLFQHVSGDTTRSLWRLEAAGEKSNAQ
jgi:hypothetical protein